MSPMIPASAREFPASALQPPDGVSRREFLRLAAASAALAGLAGCTQPPADPILPYVRMARELTPGIPAHFATAMVTSGEAVGLVVESHEGRPTKVEGNPDHPASLGAAGIFEQASLLQLYDPDRAGQVRRGTDPGSWGAFRQAFSPQDIRRLAGERGAGLRLLLEPTSSPLVVEQLTRARELFPDSRIYFHSTVSGQAGYEATRAAYGRPLQSQLQLANADVIVSLDSDVLATGPFHLRYARHFADRRRLRGGSGTMNRLYVAESAVTVTGSSADTRLALQPTELPIAARALLAAIAGRPIPGTLRPAVRTWLGAAAADLQTRRGRGLVIAGERQPASMHLLAIAANTMLGNIGSTVDYTEPTVIDAGEPSHRLSTLAADLDGGDVTMLVVLGGNPVYTSSPDLHLGSRLARVPHAAYLGLYDNETAQRAGWFIPEAHYLESWGDGRAHDGTASIVQPLIAPLHGGHTVADVLAAILGEPDAGTYARLRRFWTSREQGGDTDAAWRDALQRGLIGDMTLPAVPARATVDLDALLTPGAESEHAADALTVICPVSNTVFDGRFANNPWLQELPDPISKLTWENTAAMSPATASRLNVGTGDLIRVTANGRSIEVPALPIAGTAEGTLVIPLGYGRAGTERVAAGAGADAYQLTSPSESYVITGPKVERIVVTTRLNQVPKNTPLGITQWHTDMEGRPIALSATLKAFHDNPDIAHEPRQLTTLYTPYPEDGVQWAMSIDLTVCTGCSACVVACQAENNIPIVGKAGVLEHRAMHWMRIDRYVSGPDGAPRADAQPMLCQQCENAPCEYVCPVGATAHSPDGLNEMAYNRCVGTRFCSNNCPYKVRRFNWFDYNASMPELLQMAKNPDVTVRERGVMEKCTFCVQRIREAEIHARVDGREFLGNEVTTACEQACPTRAIVFGSLHAPESEVAALHREPHAYSVLHELGTRPRVRYLARITNPPEGLDA